MLELWETLVRLFQHRSRVVVIVVAATMEALVDVVVVAAAVIIIHLARELASWQAR